jgi:hypothetical protein
MHEHGGGGVFVDSGRFFANIGGNSSIEIGSGRGRGGCMIDKACRGDAEAHPTSATPAVAQIDRTRRKPRDSVCRSGIDAQVILYGFVP